MAEQRKDSKIGSVLESKELGKLLSAAMLDVTRRFPGMAVVILVAESGQNPFAAHAANIDRPVAISFVRGYADQLEQMMVEDALRSAQGGPNVH